MNDAAGLAWIVNLGCIELHPHPVHTVGRTWDHPDELRASILTPDRELSGRMCARWRSK